MSKASLRRARSAAGGTQSAWRQLAQGLLLPPQVLSFRRSTVCRRRRSSKAGCRCGRLILLHRQGQLKANLLLSPYLKWGIVKVSCFRSLWVTHCTRTVRSTYWSKYESRSLNEKPPAIFQCGKGRVTFLTPGWRRWPTPSMAAECSRYCALEQSHGWRRGFAQGDSRSQFQTAQSDWSCPRVSPSQWVL